MNKIFFFLMLVFLSSAACKKEPTAFSDLNAAQRFDLLQIGCTPTNKQNYFTGTLDGKEFCYYESTTDSVSIFLAQGIISTSPFVLTGTEGQYIEGGFFLKNIGPWSPGKFKIVMIYKDTGYTGIQDWAAFMAKHFVANRLLPFSRSSSQELIDSLKSGNKVLKSHIQGLAVNFYIYDENSTYEVASVYPSTSAAQPSSSYAKCTKFIESEHSIELEMEVDMMIAGGHESVFKPKRLKGDFHFLIQK